MATGKETMTVAYTAALVGWTSCWTLPVTSVWTTDLTVSSSSGEPQRSLKFLLWTGGGAAVRKMGVCFLFPSHPHLNQSPF